MYSIINTLLLLTISVSGGPSVGPQSFEVSTRQTQRAKDPCGDPARESMLWAAVGGKVLQTDGWKHNYYIDEG